MRARILEIWDFSAAIFFGGVLTLCLRARSRGARLSAIINLVPLMILPERWVAFAINSDFWTGDRSVNGICEWELQVAIWLHLTQPGVAVLQGCDDDWCLVERAAFRFWKG